jgi:hypothetical protein
VRDGGTRGQVDQPGEQVGGHRLSSGSGVEEKSGDGRFLIPVVARQRDDSDAGDADGSRTEELP